MIQFATHTKPDIHSGYCLDDNARALLGFTQMYEKKRLKSTLDYINIYLKFIKFAQKINGKFHNFVSYQKTYSDQGESEDSFGRAVWALGYIVNNEKMPDNTRRQAKVMCKKTVRWMPELISLRAIAFTIIGLCNILQKKPDNEMEKVLKRLSDKLIRRWQKQINRPDNNSWLWFEDCLTYSNYKLPEALFRAYRITRKKEYKEVAEKSIKFLMATTFENKEYFSPIGQDGWYFRDGKRSYYDQQPEDAASAVEALAAAYLTTKKKIYADSAKLAFRWFLGKNHLNQMVYDEATGGCYDGLGKYSLNFNQGAESTISYLLARLAINKVYK